jgi:hypothetical protein
VTGFLSGGGTVVQNFATATNAWSTFALSAGFTNLTSVEFHSTGASGDMMLLDDINYNASVPAPATALILALAGLGLFGRKRG